MRVCRFVVSTLSLATLSLTVLPIANAQAPAVTGTLSKLPVQEVTVFKDGHAFVLHEGALPANADGEVVLDNLPMPVVGTFWPYEATGKLKGVVASRVPISTQRNSVTVQELLKANPGAEVIVIETPDRRFDAKILSVPQTPAPDIPDNETDAERERRMSTSFRAPQPELILLETKDGILARPLNSISQVIFKAPPRQTTETNDFRNTLRLQFDGAQRPAGSRVQVGMVYLQKGLRWIPNYRIALDGKGRAAVKMQATLINELVDLENANANFVIGVPSFAFKETIDPISLQNTFARLSPLFDNSGRSGTAFSNAIQTQVANASYARNANARGGSGQPTNAVGTDEAAGNEDFFVFTAKNLSLRKGERMTFPLVNYDLKYEDIYTLEAPARPPIEAYRSYSFEQQQAISQSLTAPQVMHKLRIFNTGTQPLTTAPTLLESNGRLLAQTLMTYTATGGRSDIDLAPAVDITVKRRENETGRTPNAMRWRDDNYARIDIGGRLIVTSYRNEPVKLELTQNFIGTVTKAEQNGVIRKLGLGDDDSDTSTAQLPAWWGYVGGDWRGINGLSAVKWSVTVPAKGTLEIPYSYSYFWR